MSYTSTRKEPVSMKLRVANMKSEEVHSRTQQLEEESRKMEDRLRELKLVMNREKEMREQRGGGHWKSGKEGSLNSHAKDVLSKPPSKPKPANSGKNRRVVRVLKDEPAVQPSKTKDKPLPGTLAFIAQRDNSKPGLRPSGPVCGQCEIKAAAVTCQECSEIYCSGCFTAFHLKGALAKHRSMPISKITSTPRGEAGVLPSNQSIAMKQRQPPSTEQTRIIWEQHQQESATVHEVKAPAEPVQLNSLLDGEYDEGEAAQSFQQALADWREETTDPEPSKPSTTQLLSARKPTQLGTRKPDVGVVSPIHTPRVNVDEGTSTVEGSTQPTTSYEPQFTNSDLSYAEKLLLKKNRRSDVPSINSSSAYFGHQPNHINGDVGDDDGGAYEEPVSFDSILATIQQPALQAHSDESDGITPAIDIQEFYGDESTVGDSIDEESHYVVSEEVEEPTQMGENDGVSDDYRYLATVLPAQTAFFLKTSSSPRSFHSKKVVEPLTSSLQVTDVTEATEISVDTQNTSSAENRLQSAKHRRDDKLAPDMTSSHVTTAERINGGSTGPRGPRQRPNSRSEPLAGKDKQLAAGMQSASKSLRPVSRNQPPTSLTQRPASSLGRSSSSLGRPSSSLARPSSRNNTSFHRSARPRTAAEKAADMFGEGTLTKKPSSALTDIVARYKDTETNSHSSTPSYNDSLGGFFTAGVKQVFTERVLTARKEKPAVPGTPLKKHQMSSKVYALSGKSWRPDSSLGGSVEDEQVSKFYQEFDMSLLGSDDATPIQEDTQTTIRYSWSANLTGADLTNSISQSLSERLALPDNYPTAGIDVVDHSMPSPAMHSVRRSKTDYSVSTTKPEFRPSSARWRSQTPLSARCHTPIVVDGDDMTRYDTIMLPNDGVDDDLDAMNDLELELASQTGRLTAEGRVSRVVADEAEDISDSQTRLHIPQRSTTPDTHRDIDRLRESLMDDFEESELLIMQDEAMRVSLL